MADVTWVDGVTAVAAVAAVVFAAFAWFTSVNALRTSYRPVVRTIPAEKGETSFADPAQLILKNIGFGPAVSAMLFERPTPETAQPIAELALVETLGESTGVEAARSGRMTMTLSGHFMSHDRDYRLLYQDVAGGWHETRFTFRQHDVIMRMLGPYRWWHGFLPSRRIPQSARSRGQVVRVVEGL